MKFLAWLLSILHVVLIVVIVYAVWEMAQTLEQLTDFLGRH